MIKSLTSSIAQSVIWIDNAADLWKDLHNRFSQVDAVRISDLQEEITSLKQGSMSVTDYFTNLKILWDEFVNLRNIPTYICVPQCSYNALKIVKDH